MIVAVQFGSRFKSCTLIGDGTCKRCGGEIIWAQTPNGTFIPLEVEEPVPGIMEPQSRSGLIECVDTQKCRFHGILLWQLCIGSWLNRPQRGRSKDLLMQLQPEHRRNGAALEQTWDKTAARWSSKRLTPCCSPGSIGAVGCRARRYEM